MLLLLAIPLAAAEEVEDYDNYGSLEISVKEEVSVVATPEGTGNARVDSLFANLTLFPREDGSQIVLSQQPYSEPYSTMDQSDKAITFSWKDPTATTFKMEVDSVIQTVNSFPKISSKVEFPLRAIEEDWKGYTQATKSIDINEDIRKTATDIVQGQTDYYKAISKLADWVQDNVRYNLTTMTEKAVLSASWVLQNKEGVCDEITNLYIALLRSMGIPARFVSGQVYSNIGHDFGNHGWAEVYFPGIGWLPVDVTLSQIGWIDPSHVKLKDAAEPTDPSVSYSWRASNLKPYINPIIIKSSVVNARGAVETHAVLTAETLKDKAGPGSYMPIKVTVKNLEDYYVPLLVHITKAPEILGSNKRATLLEPREEKVLFWTARMPEDLKPGYKYTATIEVAATFAESASTGIELSLDYENYTEEWAAESISRLAPREDKAFFPDIELACSLDQPYYYRTDIAKLVCNAKNIGNTNFKLIKACYGTSCEDIELLIGMEKEVKWSLPALEIKDSSLKVSAESKNLVRYSYAPIKIIEVPNITVFSFEPMSVPYGEKANFTFVIGSNETAYNLTLNIKDYAQFAKSEVSEKKAIVLPFNSKEFRRGKVDAVLSYHDEMGKEYADEYSFMMDITDMPWYVKMLNWIETMLN